MAEKEPQDLQVDAIVKSLLDGLVAHAERGAGAKLSPEVVKWWRNQYRAKFFYAIRVDRKVPADAQSELDKKALALGAEAKRLARDNPITPREAALASLEVDCPPRDIDQEGNILQDWCN